MPTLGSRPSRDRVFPPNIGRDRLAPADGQNIVTFYMLCRFLAVSQTSVGDPVDVSNDIIVAVRACEVISKDAYCDEPTSTSNCR